MPTKLCSSLPNASTSVWKRFNQAPLILRAYVVFTLFAALLSLSPFYSKALNEALIPYLGWSGFTGYTFSIYFAINAALVRPPKVMIYILLIFSVLSAIFGIQDTINHVLTPSVDFNNPYLTYSEIRPLFTVILPIAWSLLLISSPMRKWANKPRESS